MERKMASFAHGRRISHCCWLLRSACRRKCTNEFSPRKIIILEKTTRLKYELAMSSAREGRALTQEELKNELLARGSDFEGLQERHAVHTGAMQDIELFFAARANVAVRLVDREGYSEEAVRWCDAVLTAGGDGTFLYGAGRLPGASKPIIGINTDPARSEGVLCVRSHSTSRQCSPAHTLSQLEEGNFSWSVRQRIRTILGAQVLPHRALNEVFIAEKDPSRASYYELTVDSNNKDKQKSSGLAIFTGSGSTAWAYNINRVTPFQVGKILQLAQTMEQGSAGVHADVVDKVCEAYNHSLVFGGTDMKMRFTAREAINKGIFSASLVYGTASHLQVRSRCLDGMLVLDGQWHYDFPLGTMATFTMHPEDAIRTITHVN